ncbi:hypothetical protein ASE26_12420 [Duganella sp. Root198D2]|nr:hypothetical protein ASE26_12420 [Duganella sp. Root198D2]
MPRMKRLFHPGLRANTVRPPQSGECHNCHAPVPEKFCGQCGQPGHVHVASAHEFIHHFIGHYVAAEGKLWATLGLLFFRPGQLTLEFIQGRRGRYIDPLRLLLTISLVAFLCLKVIPAIDPAPGKKAVPEAAQAQNAVPHEAMPPLQLLVVKAFRWGSASFATNFEHYQALSSHQRNEAFFKLWLAKGPTVALLLIPLIAVWLKLVHLGNGWRYGEHLVFAMHLLAFSLAGLTLGIALAPLADAAWMAALVAIPLYLLWAMRRVYGGGLVLLLRWGAAACLTAYSFKVLMWMVFYGGLAMSPVT